MGLQKMCTVLSADVPNVNLLGALMPSARTNCSQVGSTLKQMANKKTPPFNLWVCNSNAGVISLCMEWRCFLEILGTGTEREKEIEVPNALRTLEEIVIDMTDIK